MIRRIVQRPLARRDVLDIVNYIAADNPDAASRFFDAYVSTLEVIQAQPAIGRIYEPEMTRLRDIRVFPIRGFRSYLLFSRDLGTVVEIVRVLHGARRILAALDDA